MTEEATHNAVDFGQQYILLRKKEGRIYSDKEVSSLPEIDKEHQHYTEWRIRKDTSDRLIKYLINKKKNLEVFEVGCGNGWLSAKLALIPFSRITGIDINAEELNQAKRVFGEIENLEFFNCSLQDEMFSGRKFDIIVFAASVQYFSSLERVLNESLKRLKSGGEIHIIDTHLYKQNETSAARLRSNEYYKSIGFPEMSDQYFHHSLEDLKLFGHDILYDPKSIINKLKKNKNPFYWVCIPKNA
jgi:ubiquinone/menaquinone biosynthesis C-methylase UbiE